MLIAKSNISAWKFIRNNLPEPENRNLTQANEQIC
jgi:hypothetical protein